MNNKIIRLQSFEIFNFKNIKYGKLELPSYKKNTYFEDKTDIMAIYGQNGSGKTSVIDALQIMKTLISGQKLQSDICKYIYSLADTLNLKITFFIKNDCEYLVDYDISLKRKEDSVEIISEKLSYTKLNSKGKVTIISYNENVDLSPISPDARYKELIKHNKENKIDIQVIKKLCKKENVSFVFHEDLINMFKSNENLEYYEILKTLQQYSILNLYIINNKHSVGVSLNFFPISFRSEYDYKTENVDITVNLLEKSNLTESGYKIVIKVINQINMVISNIIPNLQIELTNLGKVFNRQGEELIKVELFSIRDDLKIPLKYESEGILKIISILGTLISVFNDSSTCLVVDDLDSYIFEYLLGELLEIIDKDGKGQLVFTSHNLRLLEKLPRDCIVFSTANSENKFIRFPIIKSSKNLRNEYLRFIELGGLNEPVYEESNVYEMIHLFKKAGIVSRSTN